MNTIDLNQRPTTRRWMAVTSLVVLLALVVAASVARVAQNPLGVIDVPGWGPASFGKIRGELALIFTNNDRFDQDSARSALASKPLAAEPFAIIAAGTANQNDRVVALLRESLRRDPRSRPARIMLMKQLARTGDLPGAFDQLAALNRLSPVLVVQAMNSIDQLIVSPERLDTALKALAGHDELYDPFVAGMINKNKPREIIVPLARQLPPEVLARPSIRNNLVTLLLSVREFALARSLWQPAQASSGLVHSPDFSDQVSTSPFNWELFVNSSGAAGYLPKHGLSISYYDRSPGALAHQIVTLAPGAYQLAVDFRHVDGSADNIHLTVTCIGASGPLAEISLFSKDNRQQTATARFVVPQGCTGQDIVFAGIIADQRSESEVEVYRTEIKPDGSKQ